MRYAHQCSQNLKLFRKAKEAWENREQIDVTKPIKRTVVNALDVYNYLPKTNYKECREQMCIAFAVKLLNREKDVKDCKPLFRRSSTLVLKKCS